MTTVVTALYNIGREQLSQQHAHRPWSRYLEWFGHLLQLNAPLVVFVPPELVEFVADKRRGSEAPTRIISRRFEELAAYRYEGQIQTVIDSMRATGKRNFYHTCPEFIDARYETVIFSKFDLLHEVSSANPFDSDYFVWIDAGAFRQAPSFDTRLPWPDPHKIKLLGDRFLVADYVFNQVQPVDEFDYLRQQHNGICAYILGGTRTAITQVHSDFWQLVQRSLAAGVINNEQHLLQLLWFGNRERYFLWRRTGNYYPNLPVPLRDRMTVAELALGVRWPYSYPVTPELKLLTVATREVAESEYRRWMVTAEKFGYNYEILGRERKWTGYGLKLRIWYERLLTVEEPYTILCDCTDLVFCAPAAEAVAKLKAGVGPKVIVGVESQLWYINGRYRAAEILERYPVGYYPNTGFIAGETVALRELLSRLQDEIDDQAAVIDAGFEGARFNLDSSRQLVANLPPYEDRLQFDTRMNRYRYQDSYPIALHFPGKNYQISEYYATIIDTVESDPKYLWLALLLIVVVILAVWLLSWWM